MKFRFAPSPTGNLHIGSARTALFNWVLAKHHQASFILRIEDTDAQRSTMAFEQNIIDGLKWLGLSWDEGPDVGGPAAKYRQSERQQQGIYQTAVETLLQKGRAYPCFCSSEILEAERQQAEAEKRAPGYSGRCRNLSASEVARRKAAGETYNIRFKMEHRELIVTDQIRGEVHFQTDLISDFVILKSDGMPTFHLAVILDDALMGVTHVIRGEDHLPNTPKQMQLIQALEYPLPIYGHLPMILGPDRSKLSKRHGATSVDEYRTQGFLPEALINFLSLLGWSHPEEKEVLSLSEIVEHISLDRVKKSGAIFDVQKCQWMNKEYIKALSPDGLFERGKSFIDLERWNLVAPSQRLRLVSLLADGITVLSDFSKGWDWAVQRPFVSLDQFVVEPEQRQRVLAAAIPILQSLSGEEHPSGAAVQAKLDELNQSLDFGKGLGKSKGIVLKTLRYALTGEQHGPALAEVIGILGVKECLSRIGFL